MTAGRVCRSRELDALSLGLWCVSIFVERERCGACMFGAGKSRARGYTRRQALASVPRSVWPSCFRGHELLGVAVRQPDRFYSLVVRELGYQRRKGLRPEKPRRRSAEATTSRCMTL